MSTETMKKIALHTGLTLLMVVVFMPGVIEAGMGGLGGGSGGGGGISFPNPIEKSSLNQIVTAILDFLTTIGSVLAVFFTVYAGFLFVTARGNESQLTKAKQTLFWTLVGAMIVLGAYALAKVIENTANELKG
jgi:hypothetical protein